MDLLKTGASQLGLDLAEEQLDQFEVYFHELADWNKRANLTAIIEYEDVQIKHFLDSLTVCLTAREYLAGPVRVMHDAPRAFEDLEKGANARGVIVFS